MHPLLIYGAGGHAKVVADALVKAGVTVAGFIDDDPAATGKRMLGFQVVGTGAMIDAEWPGAGIVPAIGDNRARAALLARLKAGANPLASAIHPAAIFGNGAVIGDGSFLAAGAVVNPDAVLGEGVIVNTLASVDHDCRIGPCVHIAPGARLCGGVSVGAGTLIGTGSVVIPGITIGANAVIGAGSVVIRDVPDGARVAGNPARPI